MEDDSILSGVSSTSGSSLPILKNNPLALKLAKKSSEDGSITEGTFLAGVEETSKISRISGNVAINQTLEEMFPRSKRDKKLWAKSLQNSKRSDQSDVSDLSFCVAEKRKFLKNKPKTDLTVNLTFSDSDSCNDTLSNTNENMLRKLPLHNKKYSVNINLNDTEIESSIEESIYPKNPFQKPFNPPKIDLSLNSTTEFSKTSDKIDISNKENEFGSSKNDSSSDEYININLTRDLTVEIVEPRKSATFIISTENSPKDATFTITDKKCKVSGNDTFMSSADLTKENERISSFMSSNDTFIIGSDHGNREDSGRLENTKIDEENLSDVSGNKELLEGSRLNERKLKEMENLSINFDGYPESSRHNQGQGNEENLQKRKSNVASNISVNEETLDETQNNEEINMSNNIADCKSSRHNQEEKELNYSQHIDGNAGKLEKRKRSRPITENLEKTPKKRKTENKQNTSNIDAGLELSRQNQKEENELNCSQNNAENEQKRERSKLKKGKFKETPNKTEKNKQNMSNIAGCHESSQQNQREDELNCSKNNARNGEKLEKANIAENGEKRDRSRPMKGKFEETPNKRERNMQNMSDIAVCHESSQQNQREDELNCSKNNAGNNEKLEKGKFEETPNKRERNKQNMSNIAGCLESSQQNQREDELLSIKNNSRLKKGKLEKTPIKTEMGEKNKQNISNIAGCSESIQNNQGEQNEPNCTQNIAGNGKHLKKSLLKDADIPEKMKENLEETQNKYKKRENEQNKTGNLEASLMKKGKENEEQKNCDISRNPNKPATSKSHIDVETNENMDNSLSKKTASDANITENECTTSSDNILIRSAAHRKISTVTCNSVHHPKDISYENDALPLSRSDLIDNESYLFKRPSLPKDLTGMVVSPRRETSKPLEKTRETSKRKRITRSASKNKGKSINDSSYETDLDISSIHEYNPRKKLLIYHSTPINKVPINNTTDESIYNENNKFTPSKNVSQNMSGIQDLQSLEQIDVRAVSSNIQSQNMSDLPNLEQIEDVRAVSSNTSIMNKTSSKKSNRSTSSINKTIETSNIPQSLIETRRKTRSSSKMSLTQFTTDISSSISESDTADTDSDPGNTTKGTIDETKIRKYNKTQKCDSVFGVVIRPTRQKKPKDNLLTLPKLYKPAKWINKKLYYYLESKLKHWHKLKTRKVAEEFAILLHHTYTLVMHGHGDAINALKSKCKEIGLCETNIDYFMFIHEFTPFEFRRLVLPMGGAYGTKCSSVKIPLYKKL